MISSGQIDFGICRSRLPFQFPFPVVKIDFDSSGKKSRTDRLHVLRDFDFCTRSKVDRGRRSPDEGGDFDFHRSEVDRLPV